MYLVGFTTYIVHVFNVEGQHFQISSQMASPGVVTRVVRSRRRLPTADPDSQEQQQSKLPPKKPYYDEKDRAALRLMRKLRVDWTQPEDSLLLICRVAGAYLCQNARQQMVNYTSVRDLLHARFPESGANKTSRACQRRINYMIKNPTTAENVALYLAEVQQDEKVGMIGTEGFSYNSMSYAN